MQLTVTGLPSDTSRTTPLSPEAQQFEKAWQQVARQQKKNERLRSDVGIFAGQVKDRLQRHEKAYLEAMHLATRHLLSFFTRKSLGLWQRETLLEWVKDYLSRIQNSPFSGSINIADTLKTYFAVLDELYPRATPGEGEEDGEESDDDLLDDFFESFRQTAHARNGEFPDMDASAEDAFFDQFFQQEQQREREAKQRADELALKKLMKASSMNKLFRKLAHMLHPDRETDEAAREEKNRLMVELIKARDSNDIPALFSLYARHVGEAPLQELGSDLASVTELLKRQYEQLCEQQDKILHQDPQAGAIYQRFHRRTTQQTQEAINEHITLLRIKTRELERFCIETRSLAKLKPYLQSRRYEELDV